MTTTLDRPAAIAAATRRPHRALAPALIGLLGFLIPAVGIGIPSVWYDEAATITATTRSWPQLWAMLGNVDAVHGLYYFVMHVVFDVFGYSPVMLRIPSAIAIGAAAALVVILARHLGREHYAVLAGLVFVILPRVTWAGTEGRSYALTALAAVALTLVFVLARRSPGRRLWVLYGVLAVLSVVLFIYLALIVLAHAVTVLVTTRRRAFFVAAGLAGVVTLPFALATIAQSGQVAWIDPIGSGTIRQVVRSQWFYGSDHFAIVAWALIALGVVMAVRQRRSLALVLPLLVVPTLALVVVSLVSSPIYQPRYLTMTTPFAALAIAAGLAFIPWRKARFIALGLLVVLAVPQVLFQHSPESKENSSWSQVADLIAHERELAGESSTTAIVYGGVQRHPSATARVIAYSYPDTFAGTIDLTLQTPAAETAQLWETHEPIALSLSGLSTADVTYLITSVARDQRPETSIAMQSAGWHLVESWEFTSVHVLKYKRD